MTDSSLAGGPIRVFLLDDHEIVRQGVSALLEAEPDIRVVGEAGTAAAALARIAAARPDVAVLDVRLPDGDGTAVCREIRARMPDVACLMLTAYDDDWAFRDSIMAGCAGYVLKQIRSTNLVAAVRMVAAGEPALDPEATSRLLGWLRGQAGQHELLARLSGQERRILELVGEGLSNREVGGRTALSEKTVKNYMTLLLAKLGMQRRTQAAAFAAQVRRDHAAPREPDTPPADPGAPAELPAGPSSGSFPTATGGRPDRALRSRARAQPDRRAMTTQAPRGRPGGTGQAPGPARETTPGPQSWPSAPAPGDLSKRLTARRTELRLSIAQAAARAQMSPRYVEYLERYPARISAAGLRRLAAALHTSTSALLGGGLSAPPGHGRPAGRRALMPLTDIECHQLIAPGGIGRVAFASSSGAVVLPVNFIVIESCIVFRTRPGGVIAAHADDSPVTFEADRIDEAVGEGWSVLVQGTARRVTCPDELAALLHGATVSPWPGGDRGSYIRVIPARISGGRIVKIAS